MKKQKNETRSISDWLDFAADILWDALKNSPSFRKKCREQGVGVPNKRPFRLVIKKKVSP